MGKGIALQFKKAFPANFAAYQKACRANDVRPGTMLVVPTDAMVGPKFIFNFPTKRHWRGKSRMEDIEAGLEALAREVRDHGISSVAVPPLGCGLGGLDWEDVRPRIEHHLGDLPGVHVLLFEPGATPSATAMPIGTRRPDLTVARALFLRLMDQYANQAYRLTLLEMQKLAYLLQELGQPLRLRFEEGHYGPYAHNLNKVLEVLEGHFIRGYGDSQRPDAEIELLPGAADEARAFLEAHPDAAHRAGEVARLIEGFETPYGMELLASLHWVATRATPPLFDEARAREAVLGWNDRKRAMFRPEHIHVAWERLEGVVLAASSRPEETR
jgi:O-acetyl-ADP-ribose deacetylase (regulator of RNase III)